jgi:hypothetical protein
MQDLRKGALDGKKILETTPIFAYPHPFRGPLVAESAGPRVAPATVQSLVKDS